MNYQEMTDFEISRAVGDFVGVEWANLSENYNPLSIWPNDNFRKGEDGMFLFDPCNSWADSGPIIKAERITLTPFINSDLWQAFTPRSKFEFRDKNPLRAAMVVFLMMKGGE